MKESRKYIHKRKKKLKNLRLRATQSHLKIVRLNNANFIIKQITNIMSSIHISSLHL